MTRIADIIDGCVFNFKYNDEIVDYNNLDVTEHIS